MEVGSLQIQVVKILPLTYMKEPQGFENVTLWKTLATWRGQKRDKMKEDCQTTGILQAENEWIKDMLQTCIILQEMGRMLVSASHRLAGMMGPPWIRGQCQWQVQRPEHQARRSLLMPWNLVAFALLYLSYVGTMTSLFLPVSTFLKWECLFYISPTLYFGST